MDKALQEQLDALGTNITTLTGSYDEAKKTLASLKDVTAEVKVKADSLEKWFRELEGNIKAARFAGANGLDNLKAAIPDTQRGCISLWERHGQKPEMAMRRTAIESWCKAALTYLNPYATGEKKMSAHKTMEAVAVAFGEDQATVKAALVEGTNALGGFTVPQPLEAEVLRIMQDSAVVRPLVRKIPMTVWKHLIPDLAGNVTVAIVPENTAISDSIPNPLYGQKTLEARMFAGLGTISMQGMADSAIGMFDFVTTLMAEQYALQEDIQALEGSGTGNNFAGLVSLTAETPGTPDDTKIKEVTNGSAGAQITFAKIIEQKWKARKVGSRNGAAWIMAPEVAAKIEGLVDSQGRPLFVAPISGGATAMINPNRIAALLQGYPVYTSDEILVNRVLTTSSDCSNIYFGAFGHGMIFGDLLGLTFGASEHVNWTSAAISIRMLKRTAILVGVPADFTRQVGVRTT